MNVRTKVFVSTESSKCLTCARSVNSDKVAVSMSSGTTFTAVPHRIIWPNNRAAAAYNGNV